MRRTRRKAVCDAARARASGRAGDEPAAAPARALLFAALALVFGVLAARSLYLQWFDNVFLQEQGAARYSRELEVPAHRGRIVDRIGDPLAISTPVKSLWAFPQQFDATPAQLAALARVLETSPQTLAKRVASADDFVYLAKASVAGDRRARARAPDQRAQRPERVSPLLPGRRSHQPHHRLHRRPRRGQEGIELAQQPWLAGMPGSRRVIINRRGDVVEDVAAIRAPQEGRDLALSIDSRLQYLAFRELKNAVEANKAKAGGLVILDVRTGEILALANWPTYNPNSRDKMARERMRNRALTDVFEPGSTMKPFTIAAALDIGKVRPDTLIDTRGGVMTIGSATIHDAHREGVLTVVAGDPEVVEHRRREDRAVAVAGDDVAELSEAGFGTPPQTGFPGEVRGGCVRRSPGSRSSRRRWPTATAFR